ncbi:hydroxypyruvate isomerase family protein [Jiangella rhizosphaerae]|uniref:Hydroxypyruvate isomerase n=1 Tax=Jiangella rhizosphaerae TaxID=2293569 RepID=A0A418KNQ2_9ACTN|nr:TIM barrel protein [Jiangella rhizosphaerae]RIQ20610.1 hydroxypyruvate isomerase [Jiangella rhizosphaerae]
MPEPRFAVNCSILLTRMPLRERLDAVRAAGFEAAEFWWPFPSATPGDAEVEAFVDAVRASGLRLVGLNLFAGDLPAGERGVVSWPGREDELLASVQVAAYIGAELGCRSFNALYGNRLPGRDPAEQDAVAVENLAAAAAGLVSAGGTVLLEPVSGVDAYPLRTAAQAVAVADRVAESSGRTNLGLLLDVYHLAVNGDDVAAAIERFRDRIAHVQLADAPGRGAPGTGTLPLRAWVDDLVAGGYDGWMALEHVSDDADPFAWRTAWRTEGSRR